MFLKKSIFIFSIFFLFSCKKNIEIYDIKEIKFERIKELKDSIEIVYNPILETIYYSPGVILDETNDKINLIFPRCKINSKCKVDIKAQIDSLGFLSFKMKKTNKKIYFLTKKDKIKIY